MSECPKPTRLAFASALCAMLLLPCAPLTALDKDARADKTIQKADTDKEPEAGQKQKKEKKAKREPDKNRDGAARERPFPPPAEAWDTADVILGRPTDSEVTVSVTPNLDLDAYLEYGPSPGDFQLRTETVSIRRGESRQLALKSLEKDRLYTEVQSRSK